MGNAKFSGDFKHDVVHQITVRGIQLRKFLRDWVSATIRCIRG